MEPMNLGTPSNSGPSSPATTPTGSPYLPSFLLGEPSSPMPGSTSPQMKRGSATDSVSSYTSPRLLPQYQTHQSQLVRSDSLLSAGGGEKTSGPPIRGLFDTASSNGPTSKKLNNSDANSYITNVSRHFNEVRSPNVITEVADSTWVTVFGYPAAAATHILDQLSSCGHIVSRVVPAMGNWMHIQFSSRLEAKRALACNGKIYGNVMIGVMPCRDQEVIERTMDRSCADSTLASTSSFASPRPSRPSGVYPDLHRSVDVNASLYESPYASPRISQARPLVTRSDNELYGSGNTPQKSSGIVSKAMDYILGW